MSRHLQREIEEIRTLLFTMGGMVEESIRKSVHALCNRDVAVATEIIRKDDDIDRLEIKIEEESLKILALYTPVAEDLRFITTVLKINNDLERMADLAANICERAIYLSKNNLVPIPAEMGFMGNYTTEMVREALKAFLAADALAARRVVQMDDKVDQNHRKMLETVIAGMKAEPQTIDLRVQMLWSSRNIERIADHCTNIAEDIVYMVEGEIIRHTRWDLENVLEMKREKLDAKETNA